MPNGLAVGAGAARGVERGVENFINIMVAKEKLTREKELFKIQKKKGELDIQEAEFTTDPEVMNLRREKFKADAKQAELDLEAKGLTIKKTEEELQDELRLGIMAGTTRLGGISPERASRIAGGFGYQVPEAGPGAIDEEQFAEALRKATGITRGQAFRTKVGIKAEKKDYLLAIPPKELETKKKGFWPRLGDAMLRGITGGLAGDVTEADRTATIKESKRKYAAGEELSPDEATLLTMNSIKTKQDLEELLEKREQYEDEGVDVELILDFFAPEEEK